ncbi:hypothetical protein BGZ63DRAFT_349070 [Mariannaea sp. PMI_226]|nr:hypothetical protein BGZ63DRAFT_349070 [Mariannaea sp. PMI_226]
MSISRAFTTRKARLANDLSDFNKSPQRSNSARGHPNPHMLRNMISSPIQLVHTTNMLSYNAPDLPRPILRNKASTRSEDSESPSESHSETPSVAETTPPSSPEVSPIDSPVPNHLSTYFMIPGKATPLPKPVEAPAIPKRSPSHTKQNSYDAIARHRSVSRMSKDSNGSISTKASFTFSRSSSTSTRASSTSSATSTSTVNSSTSLPAPSPPTVHQRSYKEPPQSHPFGKELAQVTELAEEYRVSASNKEDDEDNMYIKAKSLVKFTADDYLNDVQSLLTSFFPEMTHAKPVTTMWI